LRKKRQCRVLISGNINSNATGFDITQFFKIKYFLFLTIVLDKKVARTKILVRAAIRYSLAYPLRKIRDRIYTHGENKDYLSQLASGQSGVGVVQWPAAKTIPAVPAVRRTAVKAARVNLFV